MKLGIIIGLLIYSFISTVFVIYKDNSSYFIVEKLDIVLAGPICWLFILLCNVVEYIGVHIFKFNKKPKKYKYKSSKYIQKLVKKIIKIYKTKRNIKFDVFDFDFCEDNDDWDVSGWRHLLKNSPKYEHLNNKFKTVMFKQEEDVINELNKYFIPVTSKYFDENWAVNIYKADNSPYNNKNRKLYRLKEY